MTKGSKSLGQFTGRFGDKDVLSVDIISPRRPDHASTSSFRQMIGAGQLQKSSITPVRRQEVVAPRMNKMGGGEQKSDYLVTISNPRAA